MLNWRRIGIDAATLLGIIIVGSILGGRWWGYLFIGLIAWPLVARLVPGAREPWRIKMKTCPRCAEEVRAEAQVCKHCGHEFATAPANAEPA